MARDLWLVASVLWLVVSGQWSAIYVSQTRIGYSSSMVSCRLLWISGHWIRIGYSSSHMSGHW